MADNYASGTWHVKDGRDEDFIERWKEFIRWSRETYPAMLEARLMRDRGTPGHYLSVSEWSDPASRDAWKQDEGFKTRMGACVELCENMKGADYDLAASL